jgi:UDP-3-O-[3-hydroxymyristoyl] N-acetylglucosamine deacetylase
VGVPLHCAVANRLRPGNFLPDLWNHRTVQGQVTVEGVGLHTGAQVLVTLRACDGPVRLESKAGARAALDELAIVSTTRATTVEACGGGLRVQTVEHILAAFAGLSVHEGVAIGVDGPEMPLLDGGSAAWCEALRRLPLEPGPPRLRVARQAVIQVERSRFELTPAADVEVEVLLELDDPRIAPHARWQGDPDDFRARIAPARTFALAHEVDELLGRGFARHVHPASVILIAPDAIHHAGAPFSSDEPARHKLLDLLGDLYLFGGPPRGHLRATRPGHTANTRAIRQARDEGVVVSESPADSRLVCAPRTWSG